MRILVAEDDPVSCRILEVLLAKWGHEAEAVHDGLAAWEALQSGRAPRLAVVDWMMPGLDGISICRRMAEVEPAKRAYIIMLTALDRKENIVEALDGGADDYLTKPFAPEELRARIQVGERILDLNARLTARVRELESALAHVRVLQGLLPVCVYCKRVRTDDDYWQQIEAYIAQHSEARFTHGVCPTCYKERVEPELAQFLGG